LTLAWHPVALSILALEVTMNIVHERCCGLDVHKKTVVACALVSQAAGKPRKEVRTFSTMTPDIVRMRDWLKTLGITHVAMESTGVFWKPIYNLLEGHVELLLVNAQHIKAVPGRKTDVKDAEWIADLLRHGLLRSSLIPPIWQREVRDLTRYRISVSEERSRTINRLQKILEDTNIKLSSVATDIMGASAQDMLHALLNGETDAAALAQLARGNMRSKRSLLEQALQGRLTEHHRFLIRQQLAHIQVLDQEIEQLSREIAERFRPYEAAIQRLSTIPGIKRRLAEVILAEIGTDMSRFPSARHLASWAGICPGNNESAGKRLTGRTRKGSPWLRTALVEAAQAATRSKDCYLSAQFHRLTLRRGGKKAIVAVAHTLLVIVYHVLVEETDYQELGGNYFDERDRQAIQKQLVRRLEKLGYDVTLAPTSPAA
jgi:transposase